MSQELVMVGEHAVESDAFGWDYADDDAPASEELQQAAETVAEEKVRRKAEFRAKTEAEFEQVY